MYSSYSKFDSTQITKKYKVVIPLTTIRLKAEVSGTEFHVRDCWYNQEKERRYDIRKQHTCSWKTFHMVSS